MIKNPFTHEHGRSVDYRIFLCRLSEAAYCGLLVGALGGRFTRYGTVTGAAMGVCARLTTVFCKQVRSNMEMKSDVLVPFGEGRLRARGKVLGTFWLGMCLLPWCSPGFARLMGRPIQVGTVFRYWMATAVVSMAVLPVKQGARSLADRIGMGQLTFDQGLSEWCSRPSWLGRKLPVKIDPEGLRRACKLPPLFEVTELADSPTLDAFCAQSDFFSPKMKNKITAACVKLRAAITEEEKAAEEEKAKNAAGVAVSVDAEGQKKKNSVNQEFYKLLCNVAHYMTQITDEEKKRAAMNGVVYAFNACETRQVLAFYQLLVEMHAEATSPVEKVAVRVRSVNNELKEELFSQVVDAAGFGDLDPMHLWSKLVEECHDDLGLIKGGLDAEEVYAVSHQLGAFGRWMMKSAKALFQGANKGFWIRAVSARYTPELLVNRNREFIAGDTEYRGLAMLALSEHIAKQRNCSKFDALEEVVTPFYCEEGAGGGPSSLNEEGVILLLKLTGDLANDGRLHTREENEKILAGVIEGD